MTIYEAVELMRNAVGSSGECLLMAVLADVWTEYGREMEAEALRLLAECGKTGIPESPDGGYGGYWGQSDLWRGVAGIVPSEWYNHTGGLDSSNFGDVVTERLALMDAYAAADLDARERWGRDTRALMAEVVECWRCDRKWTGQTPVDTIGSLVAIRKCHVCNGTGRPRYARCTAVTVGDSYPSDGGG